MVINKKSEVMIYALMMKTKYCQHQSIGCHYRSYLMSEWIRLSERKPEKDGRYLVCVPYAEFPSWIGVSSLRQGKFDDKGASHWMHLPKAPEK